MLRWKEHSRGARRPSADPAHGFSGLRCPLLNMGELDHMTWCSQDWNPSVHWGWRDFILFHRTTQARGTYKAYRV